MSGHQKVGCVQHDCADCQARAAKGPRYAAWIPAALQQYDQSREQVVANFELNKNRAAMVALLAPGDMLVLAAPQNLHIRRDA